MKRLSLRLSASAAPLKAARIVLTALFLAATLSGCSLFGAEEDPAAPAPSVEGSWVSSFGDGFTLSRTGSALVFAYVSPSYSASNYSGTVVNEPDLTAEEGYLTILVTESGEEYAPREGRYYVIRWEELGARGIKEGGAGKYEGGTPAPGNSGLATREEAEAELTKVNGYFDFLGTYERQ